MTYGKFPQTRMRRQRQAAWTRRMVAETELTTADLILPLFVHESAKSELIKSMPGVARHSVRAIVEIAKKAAELGIPAIALFPVVPENLKSLDGKEAYNSENLICRTIREVRATCKDSIGIIADVALDPYTTHGHDGLLEGDKVVNDKTVEILRKQAKALAVAGADIIAPSDMMDGRVGAIREALDEAGFCDVMILSYAAKYASSFYGPFREAVGSSAALASNKPKRTDKQTYQMDPRNSDEAIREVALDIEEGADMVMVKPGLPYLDIIRRVRDEFKIHVFAYQVSGEYSMIRAAADAGYIDYHQAMMESLIAMKRAGAIGIFTYGALEAAEMIRHAQSEVCSYSG